MVQVWLEADMQINCFAEVAVSYIYLLLMSDVRMY